MLKGGVNVKRISKKIIRTVISPVDIIIKDGNATIIKMPTIFKYDFHELPEAKCLKLVRKVSKSAKIENISYEEIKASMNIEDFIKYSTIEKE